MQSSPYSLPGTAQSPQPCLLAPSRCPHSDGGTPSTLRKCPHCNSPSTAFCTQGPAHRPSSALAPPEPSSLAPQSHVEPHSCPQNTQGRCRGHINTTTRALGRATLHSGTCTVPASGSALCCSPNKYPINSTSYTLGVLVWGVPLSQAAAAPAPPHSGHWW